MIFRRGPKPPLEYAMDFIEIAGETARGKHIQSGESPLHLRLLAITRTDGTHSEFVLRAPQNGWLG